MASKDGRIGRASALPEYRLAPASFGEFRMAIEPSTLPFLAKTFQGARFAVSVATAVNAAAPPF
jgi:hypothetical protein